MKTKMSYGEFCRDLVGRPAWPPWENFYDAVQGSEVPPERAARIGSRIGRAYTPGRAVNRATGIIGRRGGKTLHAVLFLLFCILILPPKRKHSDPLWVLAHAQDLRVARDVILSYAKQALMDSLLKDEVDEYRADEIRFRSGIRFTARPCTVASPRGWNLWKVLLDEVAYYGQEGMVESDADIERSALFGMLNFSDYLLLKMSTPRLPSGILKRDFDTRGDDANLICWQASSMEMNPTLDAGELERMRREDPVGAEREIDARFTSSISAFFSGEAVAGAMAHEYERLAPVEGFSYCIALDAGFVRDRFGLAVVHKEPDGRVIVDRVSVWYPPVAVEAALAEVAGICREYRNTSPWTDQYSFAALEALASRHGLSLRQEPWTNESKQAAFGVMRGLASSGKLALPRNEVLRRELVMLEARQLPGGGVRISAPPGASFHDDLACAVSMAVSKASSGASGDGPCFISSGGVSTHFTGAKPATPSKMDDVRFWPSGGRGGSLGRRGRR